MKRKFIAAAVGTLIAPLLTVVLPAPTAGAHGYIASPQSRQAQCKAGVVVCGEIKYEPQSVEGPKGLRNCHGNVGRFAELNDDGKGWRVQNLSRNARFQWTLTVQHRTSTWEYYVNGARVKEVNDNNAIPGSTVTHDVALPAGRYRLLAIWNIADTGNAFYSCVDVNVG